MDERKFAFALFVSAALHLGMLPAIFLFASGASPRQVQPFGESYIQAFLVTETVVAAGRTVTLPVRKRREAERVAPAAVPPGEVRKKAAPAEREGENLRAAAPPSAEGHAKGEVRAEFPDSFLPATLTRASVGPDAAGGRAAAVPTTGRGGGENVRQEEGVVPPPPPDAEAVPRYRDNARPDYPPLARIRGYQGVVVLRVEVLADGRVGHVGIRRSAGHEILDRTALEAVRTWKFDPGRRGGHAVAMSVEVPVRFVLNGNSVW